jgi:hypothetical protein
LEIELPSIHLKKAAKSEGKSNFSRGNERVPKRNPRLIVKLIFGNAGGYDDQNQHQAALLSRLVMSRAFLGIRIRKLAGPKLKRHEITSQKALVPCHVETFKSYKSRVRKTTSDMHRILTQLPLFLCALLAGLWVPSQSLAQFHQTFENLTPSWQRSETDCVIQNRRWDVRRVNEQEVNNRFERIKFATGHGTHIFVTHDVTPALVIPELKPSVRIRSEHRGAKIFARVVLPETPSPDGVGPMTTLVAGEAYRSNGKWQTIAIETRGSNRNLADRLREKIWLLRREHGHHVTAKGAYVDKVVLNLYSGPGETTVDIDDLKVDGVVEAKPVIASRSAAVVRDRQVKAASGIQADSDKKPSLVLRDGTVLLVKKQPYFAKIIQHNGEPFDYLKALGFNVIELNSTASYEQLEQASKLDVWLICPPPSSVGLSSIPFHFDRVMAWKLGDRLTGRDLPVVEQRVREIRESDPRIGRPIFGHAASDWTGLAELTDILVAGIKPLGTSFIASQYSDWIQARSNAIGNGKPIWADVQTELSTELIRQAKALARNLPPTPVEPQQIKFLAYEAIAGGARGLRFTSANRLDGVDPVTRLRALSLQWINAELTQLEPWIAGGAVMGPVPVDAGKGIEVTAINTNRSRLLLIQRPTHHEQYLAGDQPPSMVRFMDAESAFTDNAHLIGLSGLETLPSVRGINGTELKIDNCPYAAAVVLTQDPLVVNWLSSSYQRLSKQSILQMRFELTQQWLAIQQLIGAQMNRIGRRTPAASAELALATSAIGNANRMLEQKNQLSAEQFLNQANFHLAQARREVINEPLASFQSKSSAALTSHCSLIPLHWTLAKTLAAGKWRPNGLPGGDFENLEHMRSSGWQNRRAQTDAITTKVQIAKSAAVDGQYGLKLTVLPSQNFRRQGGLVETPPLMIQTPPVKLKAGQFVRIHGWVNVPKTLTGSHDGLRITDSLAGPAMAERIPITSGWQEFSLYRAVETTTQFTVQFEMTGMGTANIDEVTIRAIDLPAEGLRQAKRQ